MPRYGKKPVVVDVQLMVAPNNFGALGTLNTGDALIMDASGVFYSMSCLAFHSAYDLLSSQTTPLTGTDIL